MLRWVTAAVVVVSLSGVLVGCGSDPAPSTARGATTGSCTEAPQGTEQAHHFQSAATGERERYRVYRPPGVTRDATLPVLVLLHGFTSDDTQWLRLGITRTANCLLAAQEIRPTLIVLVDGGEVEEDDAGPVTRMQRLVVDEILPRVRRDDGASRRRSDTRIGGISLGGGWALRIAAARPDLFSAVGGHSPASLLATSQMGRLAAAHTRVWIDRGEDDPVIPKLGQTVAALGEAGVELTVHYWPGAHTDEYWSAHLADYLRFYDGSS